MPAALISAADLFRANGGDLATFGTMSVAAYQLGAHEVASSNNNAGGAGALDAYTVLGAGLHWLTPAELAMGGVETLAVTPVAGNSDFPFKGLTGGIYANANSAALVGRTSDALFIAFRGTNDNNAPPTPDGPDVSDWLAMPAHYARYAPLLDAIEAYVNAPANGITRVYLTGHSLGASMAQALMQDTTFQVSAQMQAMLLAPPGYGLGIADDLRITNLTVDDDTIVTAQWFQDNSGDLNVLEDTFTNGASDAWHASGYYRAYTQFLSSNGVDVAALRQVNGIDYDTIIARTSTFDPVSGAYGIGAANDVLDGYVLARDLFVGGAGNDTMNGGTFQDAAFGGTGNDVALFSGDVDDYSIMRAGRGYQIADSRFLGDSTDYLYQVEIARFLGDSAPVDITLGFWGTELADSFTSPALGGFVDGNGGNDTLIGNAGIDYINGGAGDDLLTGLGSADELDGGTGDDTLAGGAGADLINGGSGSDWADYRNAVGALEGAVRADLVAPAGNSGDAAGDTYVSIENLIGSDYTDTLAGDGNDNILVGGGFNDTLDGRAGIDTASYRFATTPVYVSLATPASNSGEAGGDVFVSIENIEGSGLNDTLIGNAGANLLAAGAGDDTLVGLAGTDTLTGGSGNDTYVIDTFLDLIVEEIGGGLDTVLAEESYIFHANVENVALSAPGNFGVIGNELANLIDGNSGGNGMIGGLGNDTINGGDGNDTINGQGGDDLTSGGTGIDVFFVDSAGDVVTDVVEPGVYDTIWTTVSLTLPDNVEILILDGGVLAINGTGNDGPADTEPNLMLGNNAANVLTTFSGSDIVLGLDGDDTIVTGGGTGLGYDVLAGGRGNDTLTGGAGHDYFTFTNIDEAGDLITDFTTAGANLDILDLRPLFPTFTNTAGITTVEQAIASGHLTYGLANSTTTLVYADVDGGHNDNVLLATLPGANIVTLQILTLI